MKTILKKSALLVMSLIFLVSCGDPNIESAKLDLRNENYEGVLESANRALETNPDNAVAYYYKGIAHAELTKKKPINQRVEGYEKAGNALKKAIELGEAMDRVPAEVRLAEIQLGELWRVEVNSAYRLIVPEDESTPSSEDLQKAIHYLNNAYTLQPDSTQAITMYSFTYELLGDYDNSIKYTEMLIERESDDPDVNTFLRLAYFHSLTGNRARTAEVLADARVIFPNNVEVVQEQANNYLAMQDLDNALQVVRELIDSDPENAQYRLVFGTQVYQLVLDMNDELRSAFDIVRENESLLRQEERKSRPDREYVAQLRSTIATGEEQINSLNTKIQDLTKQAEAELLIAADLDQDEPITFSTLGIINLNRAANLFTISEREFDSGNRAKADEAQAKAIVAIQDSLPFFERAAELDPDNSEHWINLFRVYSRLGMTEKMLEAQEKSGL